MADIKCQICYAEFKRKSSLIYHQKTNKTCLLKQGKINKDFQCEYCDKILSTPSRLNAHISICKIKINKTKEQTEEYFSKVENKLDEYKNEISEYKIKLKEKDAILSEKDQYILKLEEMLRNATNSIVDIAKQPKTTNSTINTNSNNRIKTNIQNNFDINDIQKITNVLENHLTPEVLSQGQKGVAEMLKEHLLQTKDGEPLYECTDVSRQKFEFINKDGVVEVDSKATKLLTSLNKANIYDKAHITGQKLWEKEDGSIDHTAQHVHMPKVTEVLGINQDSSKLRAHLASITCR